MAFAEGLAGEIKARGGGDAVASSTTSNAEIARQTFSPQGCGAKASLALSRNRGLGATTNAIVFMKGSTKLLTPA